MSKYCIMRIGDVICGEYANVAVIAHEEDGKHIAVRLTDNIHRIEIFFGFGPGSLLKLIDAHIDELTKLKVSEFVAHHKLTNYNHLYGGCLSYSSICASILTIEPLLQDAEKRYLNTGQYGSNYGKTLTVRYP